MSKRQPDEASPASTAIVKRSKGDEQSSGAGLPSSKAIVRKSEGTIIAVVSEEEEHMDGRVAGWLIFVFAQGAQRTSDLAAPTLRLTGHGGNVTSAVFAPGGAALASGGFDGRVLLWNTFGEVGAYQAMQHSKAVLSVAWGSDGAHVFSASADQSVCVWDSETGGRVSRAREHGSVVNDVATAAAEPATYASGSDDGGTRLWDVRSSRSRATLSSAYQVLAVALSKDAGLLYSAGVDDRIQVHDARKLDAPLLRLAGHRESVTSLSLSADGAYLLSNARDNTVRIWDARPFSSRANRCLKIFVGATHDNEVSECAYVMRRCC